MNTLYVYYSKKQKVLILSVKILLENLIHTCAMDDSKGCQFQCSLKLVDTTALLKDKKKFAFAHLWICTFEIYELSNDNITIGRHFFTVKF